MKKNFLFAIAALVFSITVNAQATTSTQPTSSKDDKSVQKAKAEADLTDALQQTGLTDDQSAQVRDVLKDASKRSSELKKDTTLSEADKAVKKDEINSEKNDKLKQIMGKEKYKQWNEIRKKQKEQSMPQPASTGAPKK